VARVRWPFGRPKQSPAHSLRQLQTVSVAVRRAVGLCFSGLAGERESSLMSETLAHN